MLTIGAIVSQGAILLTVSAVARLVPKADLGTFQQLSLVYSLIAPLFLGGIPAALLYFLPRAHGRDQEIHDWIVRAYVLLLLFGLLSSFFILLLRGSIASLLHNPQLAPALALFAPYVCFAFLTAAAPNVLVATGRARTAALVNALVGICTFVGVIAAAIIQPTAQSLAIGLSVAGGVTALASLVIVRRLHGFAPRWTLLSISSWRPLLGFGLPLALGGLTARIGYQFDQVVVGTNFPPSQFAVYALGALELPISLLLQQAVSNVLAPELTTLWKAGDVEGMVAVWREALRKTTLLIAPLFMYFMVETPDVIRLLYGPQFTESGAIFRIYLLLMPLRIATWGLIPQAVGRTRVNFIAAWIILPINVITALVLVGPLGLKGPAFAAPIAALITTLYYLIRIKGIISVPIRTLLPLRQGILCFAVSGCMAAMLVPLHWLEVPAIIRLGVSFLVFVPLSVVVFRYLRLINEGDWVRLRRQVQSLSPLSG